MKEGAHPNAALPTTSMVMWPNWRQMLSSRSSCAARLRMLTSRSAPTFISLEDISSEAELNTGSQLALALLWNSLLQVTDGVCHLQHRTLLAGAFKEQAWLCAGTAEEWEKSGEVKAQRRAVHKARHASFTEATADSLIGAEEPRLVEGLLFACEKGRRTSELMPCAQPQAHQPAQAAHLTTTGSCLDRWRSSQSFPVSVKADKCSVVKSEEHAPRQLCIIDDHHRLRSRKVLRSNSWSIICQMRLGSWQHYTASRSAMLRSTGVVPYLEHLAILLAPFCVHDVWALRTKEATKILLLFQELPRSFLCFRNSTSLHCCCRISDLRHILSILLWVWRCGKGRTCVSTSGKLPRNHAPVGPEDARKTHQPNQTG